MPSVVFDCLQKLFLQKLEWNATYPKRFFVQTNEGRKWFLEK